MGVVGFYQYFFYCPKCLKIIIILQNVEKRNCLSHEVRYFKVCLNYFYIMLIFLIFKKPGFASVEGPYKISGLPQEYQTVGHITNVSFVHTKLFFKYAERCALKPPK